MGKVLHDDDTPAPAHDLAARRRQRLGQIVDSRRAARLEELSAVLGVSQATVRRDLDALATTGRLRRVHGGAVAVDEHLDEPHFDAKASTASASTNVASTTSTGRAAVMGARLIGHLPAAQRAPW